jgi:hypothetical protein
MKSSALFLCALVGVAGCSQHQGTVPSGISAMSPAQTKFAKLESRARLQPAGAIPKLGSRTVDYRAVLVPTDVAAWARAKFGLPIASQRSLMERAATSTVSYLIGVSGRAPASIRRRLSTTCLYLLTFTNYDDGTSELTSVDPLGCYANNDGTVGSDGGADGGGSTGTDGKAPSVPANPGCGTASKTAGTAVAAIYNTMPGIPNSTTPAEAYSYIYQNDATGAFFWDAIQALSLNGAMEGTPNPAKDYPGFTLVGIAHTHPQGAPIDTDITHPTYHTHFSLADYNFATAGHNPPLGMYLGVSDDKGDHFYELKEDATGKVTGENAGGATSSGC